jgi:hypothetical protein
METLRGGANNRVYRVWDDSREAVLKHYFTTPNDKRDRFRAERAFYEIATQAGLDCVPEPLGWEPGLRAGLFSLVAGRKLQPPEVDRGKVQEAMTFLARLNQRRDAAHSILPASEACFTLSEHLHCVEIRVKRLEQIEGTEALFRQARQFISSRLIPAWHLVQSRIKTAIEKTPDAATPLPQNLRCLSPSDFGFHNALLTREGQLRFFDFEYSGWDDPAKLICDFFCQPELPVSREHWPLVNETIENMMGQKSHAHRAELLYPAYQVKWCCIMLNDFARGGQERREFSLGEAAVQTRLQAQLAKAERLVEAIE